MHSPIKLKNPAAQAVVVTTTPVALYYGNARNPLAEIVPDSHWPGMWRVRWPDGAVSDMTNVSRAKDAAVAIAERGPPARNRRRLHFRAVEIALRGTARRAIAPSRTGGDRGRINGRAGARAAQQ
jgi:hypothetical protein